MEPLKRCANGCDAPPKPPSLVICGKCMDKVSSNLEAIIKSMEPRPSQLKGGEAK